MRLMQWMDASKALLVEARYQNLRRLVVGQGRVLFSQNFPGTAPKGCADLSCRTRTTVVGQTGTACLSDDLGRNGFASSGAISLKVLPRDG